MKLNEAFSIEFEITPPGPGCGDADCVTALQESGLPGDLGHDADGPELRVSLIKWPDWPKVEAMCAQLRAKGYTASSRTGTHVHFDIRKYIKAQFIESYDYDGEYLQYLDQVSTKYGRFLYAWAIFESALYNVCKTSYHRQEQWARSIRKDGGAAGYRFYRRFFDGSSSPVSLDELRDVKKCSLWPISNFGSVEVRMHNGTLNTTRLGAWIELVQTMLGGAHRFPLDYYDEIRSARPHTRRLPAFRKWMQEIDPVNAPQFLTVLDKEDA